MRAPVETTACTIPVSIILEMTLPILAMVMAPESVSTTLQSGSRTMARVTSRASPSERPLKAVFAIARRREAKEVTWSRSRLSRATRPSERPSWNSRESDMAFDVSAWWAPGGAAVALESAVRQSELKERLDALYRQYDHRFVDPDPLQFVRAQTEDEDREVVGMVASALAFGNVATIKNSVAAVLEVLGPRPARAVRRLDPGDAARRLRGFKHRWSDGRDVACLLFLLRQMLESHG